MPARTNRIKQDGKKVFVEIRVNIVEDHGYFVACSPALDLTTYAKTPEKARERFLEAVGIFFEDTLQKGTLEKVLLGLGWKLQKISSLTGTSEKTDTGRSRNLGSARWIS